MIPSKRHFPRAAGLFGRIAEIPARVEDRCDISPDIPSPESYRAALLRKAVAFTVGTPADDERRR